MTTTQKACLKCKGTGELVSEAWTANDGTHFPERRRVCCYCQGAKFFPEPNIPAIMEAIKGRKGLRSARPKDARAYYVWRLARFHGGADVTMPVCAMTDNDGDPYLPVLDVIADKVAKHVFGTNSAAAYRWGNALGHNLTVPDSEPASAHSCGPVADEHKPIEEVMELL